MDLAKLDSLPNTPMWQQFAPIKRQAPDALLFYRMGDFYELFLDDAVEASEILGITLTARHKDNDNPIPMCGVPFHSATNYINKLLAHGKRVAICEQVSDPAQSKGIVQREIIRIVSPGMAYDNDSLAANENNFFFALSLTDEAFRAQEKIIHGHYCALDISTGESWHGEFSSLDDFLREFSWVRPRELLISETLAASMLWRDIVAAVPRELFPCVTQLPDYYFLAKSAHEDLCRHFAVHNLEAFGLSHEHPALGAIGAAFRKTRENQKLGNLCHLQGPRPRRASDYLDVDDKTLEHLDIFPKPDRSEKESLLFHIDRTLTAMGARKLKSILQTPLKSMAEILLRQEAITALISQPAYLDSLRATLRGIRDLERLIAKLGLRSATPRDLLALKETLQRMPYVKAHVERFEQSKLLREINSNIKTFDELTRVLTERLREEPPAHAREGNIFTKGWHSDLDELIALCTDGVQVIADMETRERQATGINTLKIRYNRVFGYYIEITKTNLKHAPSHYIRKQTTANSERYITEELKNFEEKVLHAEEKRIRLESALFDELLELVTKESKKILESAQELAWVDVFQGFAQAALEGNYICPEILSAGQGMNLEIIGGRHPVIENLVGRDHFVANDIRFDSDSQLFLITGPNMAGKSTFMRQVATLTLLAHTGSFIPAASARIGIVDRIASRVGASDRIGRGQSTFMVEMNEMARILRQATSQSLLIIDEIGRGTSTFDGLALAWAILEDIQLRLHCRTLFATHYHELTALESQISGVQNLSVLVKEENGEVIFLHKVARGRADGSYGIEVAKLAGVPAPVLTRASEILARLEKTSTKDKKRRQEIAGTQQMSLFGHGSAASAAAPAKPPEYLSKIERELIALDLNQCTPLDALLKIKAFKDQIPSGYTQ